MTKVDWQPEETAPIRKRVIVWSHGPQFAVKDEHGQWRRLHGAPFHYKPSHWATWLEGPKKR